MKKILMVIVAAIILATIFLAGCIPPPVRRSPYHKHYRYPYHQHYPHPGHHPRRR